MKKNGGMHTSNWKTIFVIGENEKDILDRYDLHFNGSLTTKIRRQKRRKLIDPNDERRKKKLHVFKFDVEKMINDRQQSNFESFDKFEIKSLSIDIQRDDSTFLDTNFEESDFLFHDDMMDMKLSDDLLDERNVHLLL